MPLLLQNSHILTKKSKKDILMNKGQSLWKPQDDIDHFKTEQDILMLSIVSKFPLVPFEITSLYRVNIANNGKRAITLICLFDLILYVPSTIFQLNRDESSWVEPVLS